MEKYIIAALVSNRFGVLARISGMFARRGYNIESLTVAATHDPGCSRMTIVVLGDEYILSQITKQLSKQVDVLRVERMTPVNSVTRELLLIKVAPAVSEQTELMHTASAFGARVADISEGAVTLEISEGSAVVDAFINAMEKYDILELCRTGATSMERGRESIYGEAGDGEES